MSLTVISEVWRALKVEIDENNLPDAAESLVNVLIDNDYDTEEIKDAFRREPVVMEALRDNDSQYDEEEEELEEEEEDYDYDDEW